VLAVHVCPDGKWISLLVVCSHSELFVLLLEMNIIEYYYGVVKFKKTLRALDSEKVDNIFTLTDGQISQSCECLNVL